MKIKQIGLLCLSLLMCSFVSAQSVDMRYRLVGSIGSSGYYKYNLSNITTYQVGGEVDFKLAAPGDAEIYITSGIRLKKQGGRDFTLQTGKYNVNAQYLHIPILIRFEDLVWDIPWLSYYCAAGVYGAVGISGTARWRDYTITKDPLLDPPPHEVKVAGNSVSAFSKSQLHRFDSGAELRLGFVVSAHWQIGMGGTVGFFDAFRKRSGINTSLTFDLGYIF